MTYLDIKPWENEPAAHSWTHAGLRCEIRRGPLNNYCGYVGVNLKHSVSRKHYSEIEIEKEPHGGITFSNWGTQIGLDSNIWWIGFDCAHYWDYTPIVRYGNVGKSTYRAFGYVVNEVNKLAEELAKKGNK